jgi:hypothetical protein
VAPLIQRTDPWCSVLASKVSTLSGRRCKIWSDEAVGYSALADEGSLNRSAAISDVTAWLSNVAVK